MRRPSRFLVSVALAGALTLAPTSIQAAEVEAESIPLANQRVMVLSVDDFISGSRYVEGSGRMISIVLLRTLTERGIDAVAGESRSLATGLDEARDKGAALVAVPKMNRYRQRRKSVALDVEIHWHGLDRTPVASCSTEVEKGVAKNEQPRVTDLLGDALSQCVTDAYEIPPPEGGSPRPVQAPASLIYGKQTGDLESAEFVRAGDQAETIDEVLKALRAGQPVMVHRLYERGTSLVQRFEVFAASMQPLVVETAIDRDRSAAGMRMRQRMDDRTVMAMIDAMSSRGMPPLPLDQLAIPKTDPLDRAITTISLSPPRPLSSALKVASEPPESLVWMRVTIDEAGEVAEAAMLGEDNPAAVATMKQMSFLPGTRNGKPETVTCLFAVSGFR